MIFLPRPWLIYVNLLIAFALQIIPMPEFAEGLRPLWVAMTVLFWNITLPSHVNIGVSWTIGLCLDLITGSSLGQHALAMILMSYIAIRLYKEYRLFSVLQQLMLVLTAFFVYQGVINWIWGIGQGAEYKMIWAPIASSVVLWHWYQALLKQLNQKFRGGISKNDH